MRPILPKRRCNAQHLRYSAGITHPERSLAAEMCASRGRDGVESRAPIVLGDSPLRSHPAAIFESPQRGIEGAFFDPKDVVGRGLDPTCDAVAMGGAGEQRFENENTERALEQVTGVGTHV